MKIRVENNRIDKVLIREYLKEIERTVIIMDGLDDLNAYRRGLENDFAKLLKAKFAYSVDSGTDALQLALLVLGIRRNDEVIIPDLTYVSTALAVKFAGANPVLVDVKREDLTIDESRIEKAINSKTKAIIAVHMFGNPCNMILLKKIAAKYKLSLIEDACQAMGSKYKGKSVGTFGEISAFSFSYYKPISSLGGSGGMLVFSNEKYINILDKFVNLWRVDNRLGLLNKKFNKISLPDIATVKVKLRYIDKILVSRDKIRSLYESGLSSVEELRFIRLQSGISAAKENFLILAKNRDGLLNYLKKANIDTEMPYPPIHTLDIFKNTLTNMVFPNSSNYYEQALHLPLYSFMKAQECLYVIEKIKEFYGR